MSAKGERTGEQQRQDGEKTEEIRRGQVEKSPPTVTHHLSTQAPDGGELSHPVNTSIQARYPAAYTVSLAANYASRCSPRVSVTVCMCVRVQVIM